MEYKWRTKAEWQQLCYDQGMTDLQNFLVRMIIMFYDNPIVADEAYSGLINDQLVNWASPEEQTEEDCDNNGGNCDNYLLESYSDEYYD